MLERPASIAGRARREQVRRGILPPALVAAAGDGCGRRSSESSIKSATAPVIERTQAERREHLREPASPPRRRHGCSISGQRPIEEVVSDHDASSSVDAQTVIRHTATWATAEAGDRSRLRRCGAWRRSHAGKRADMVACQCQIAMPAEGGRGGACAAERLTGLRPDVTRTRASRPAPRSCARYHPSDGLDLLRAAIREMDRDEIVNGMMTTMIEQPTGRRPMRARARLSTIAMTPARSRRRLFRRVAEEERAQNVGVDAEMSTSALASGPTRSEPRSDERRAIAGDDSR